MALEGIRELGGFLFSPMELPAKAITVTVNDLKASVWSAVATGSLAIVSGIFYKSVLQEGSWKALASYVCEASGISCITCVAAAAFILYNHASIPIKEKNPSLKFMEVNKRTSLFEKGMLFTSIIGVIASLAVRHIIPINPALNSAANYAVYPLFSVAMTAIAFRIFHLWNHLQD